MSSSVSIWRWINGQYLIETFDPSIAAKISKWSFSKPGYTYGVNHYRRQFIIPAKKYRLACKLLGLAYEKNPNRVKAGKQASGKHPIRRGQV